MNDAQKNSEVKMFVASRSDVGRTREINEDSCAIADLHTGDLVLRGDGTWSAEVSAQPVLLALSDGMGGHQAGEVASQMVVESLTAALAQSYRQGAIEQAIESAVLRANAAVHNAANDAHRRGMGATLTAAFVQGDAAWIVEVGDSRGYVLRDGRLRQVTRDQSMVQFLIDNGVMTPEAARNSSNRNMILQAMGLGPDVRAAICRLQLFAGDKLLLCSDGISNAMHDDEIRQILQESEPVDACARLIDLANERGGKDNLTAMVASFDGAGLGSLRPPSITRTIHVIQEYDALIKPSFSHPPENTDLSPSAPPVAEVQPAPQAAPSAPARIGPDLRVLLVIAAACVALLLLWLWMDR